MLKPVNKVKIETRAGGDLGSLRQGRLRENAGFAQCIPVQWADLAEYYWVEQGNRRRNDPRLLKSKLGVLFGASQAEVWGAKENCDICED